MKIKAIQAQKKRFDVHSPFSQTLSQAMKKLLGSPVHPVVNHFFSYCIFGGSILFMKKLRRQGLQNVRAREFLYESQKKNQPPIGWMASARTIIIIVALSSCSSPPEKYFGIPISEKRTDQFFFIDGDRDTTIFGANGTEITLKANSLTSKTGSAQQRVQVRLKEFYSVRDFITHGLSTNTTEGGILRSSGMIFLEALDGSGQRMVIRKDQPIRISFPRLQPFREASLYEGKTGVNGAFQWTEGSKQVQDTIVIRKVKHTQTETWGITNAYYQLVVGNDTVTITDENYPHYEKTIENAKRLYQTDGSTSRDLIQSYYYNENAPYIFESTFFGYLNCDILVPDDQYAQVKVLAHPDSRVVIVLDSMRSAVSWDSAHDRSYFFKVVKGHPFSVLSYRRIGNKDYFGIKKVDNLVGEITIEEKENTMENIARQLEGLR